MQKEKRSMVQTCSAYNCLERWKKGSDISFHLLPKDVNLRTLWIFATGREDFNPSSHARICSKHFTSDCFVRNPWNARRELKPEAVPSIFEIPINSKGNIVPSYNELVMNGSITLNGTETHELNNTNVQSDNGTLEPILKCPKNVQDEIGWKNTLAIKAVNNPTLLPILNIHGLDAIGERMSSKSPSAVSNSPQQSIRQGTSIQNTEKIGSVLRNVRIKLSTNPSVRSTAGSFPNPELINNDCVTSTILAVSNPEIGEYMCSCELNSQKPQVLNATKTTGKGIQDSPILIPLQDMENECPQKRKRFAYFGDFTDGESDFDKYREVARKVIQKKKVQVRALQQKNRRLIKKIEKLKSALEIRHPEDTDEESSSETSSETERHIQSETEAQMDISEETAHLENTQYDQEGSSVLQDIVKTETVLIKQEDMNETIPFEGTGNTPQEPDQRDACSFFGQYVAAELRSLPVQDRISLQQRIQSCIVAALLGNTNNSSSP